MFIDSHTHLDHCREEAAELVADARAAGVGLIIQSGTDRARSRRSVELAGEFPEVVATVGYHPHEAGRLDEAGLAEIESWTAHPRVVAVGETGFDYYHDHWPHGVQGEVFVRHLELARRAGLPVVVHTRDAAEDTLATLKAHAQGLTVILHCYSLPELLAEVVGRGYFISFAGNVTYRNAPSLQQAAREVPSDLLLLETDAPWLAPMPARGRPNRPGMVARTYEFVAGLRGVSVADLASQVEANILRAFPRVRAVLEAAR
jgi:TatD DNase family protein